MNTADSNKISQLLESHGYQPIEFPKDFKRTAHVMKEFEIIGKSDIVIVNTCCIRHNAEERALGYISSLKVLKKFNPNITLAVCGCIPKEEGIDFKKDFPHIDLVFGPGESEKLEEFISSSTILRKATDGPPSPYNGEGLNKPSLRSGEGGPREGRAVGEVYLTIMTGCDNFCSYCIVPFVRGREKSRPIQEVICEFKGLIDAGAKDITLLGQNVNSYKDGITNLFHKIGEILKDREDVIVRFMTAHPKDMSDDFIKAIAKYDWAIKEIHLPLQSGDDEVLKNMNRKYTVEQFKEIINKIRGLMPSARLTTDIIVGFPGETRKQFENTLRAIKEIGFHMVNMAAYSPRPKTAAASMDNQIDETEKSKRFEEIKEWVRKYRRK